MMQNLRKAQTMSQILPLTNGLFSHMNYTFRAEVTKGNLDIQFLAGYSKRNPSPIVEMIQGTYGQKLTDAELTTLAGVILEMYKEKWDKLGSIYDIQYDPIHNYLDEWEDEKDETVNKDLASSQIDTTTYGKISSVTGTRSDTGSSSTVVTEDSTRTRTDNLTKTETHNIHNAETLTNNLSEQTSYGKTDTRTDNLKEETSYGKTETRTDNLTETNTYGKTDTMTDNLTRGEQRSETDTGSNSNTQSVWAFNAASSSNTNSDSGSNSDTKTMNDTVQNTGTETHVLSGSDGRTNTGTQATAGSGKDTVDNTGTQANVSSGSDTTTNTGTRTTSSDVTGSITTGDTGTETIVNDNDAETRVSSILSRTTSTTDTLSGSDSLAKSGTGSEDVTTDQNRSGRHFGNIGNLTSQKMILEEINLWKWNYVKEILSDVKEFCTLPVYLNATEWQLVDQP